MSKVIVNVPEGGITITNADVKQIKINAGIQEIDKELASHWYFVASGGKIVSDAPENDADAEELMEDEAELEKAEAEGDAEAAAEAQAKIDNVKNRKRG